MADLGPRECLGGWQAHAEFIERLAGSGEQESESHYSVGTVRMGHLVGAVEP